MTDETQHKKRIGRTFALAAKSVTMEQFRHFDQTTTNIPMRAYTRTRTCRWWPSSWYRRRRTATG